MPKLNQQRRKMIRAALKIHEYLHGPARAPIDELPQFLWDRVSQVHARWRHVQSLQWQAASQSLIDELYHSAGQLIRELEAFKAGLPPRPATASLAAPSEIVADLQALADEFEELEIDMAERAISVVTEPIVLDDVRLGSFRIELRWDRIGQAKAYKVIAREPNCASGRDDVTHPHVSQETLCEGDGVLPIKAALASGRLLDFFILVRQILNTYNAASPHVALEIWDGVCCSDCGTSMSRDEGGHCDRCDESLCSECSTLCNTCDAYVCTGCSADCDECGNRHCLSCLTTPAGSGRRLLCKHCLEQGEIADDSDDSNDQPAEAPSPPPETVPPAAAEADGLRDGQAPVPPRSGTNRSRRVRRVSARRPAARGRRATRPAAVHADEREV